MLTPTQNLIAQISSMQEYGTGFRRDLVTGILVQLLRTHFANPEFYDNPQLAGLVWREDLTGNLSIIGSGQFEDTFAGNRPAIVVIPGDWTFEQIGIGNRNLGAQPADASRPHEMRQTGSHTIRVLVDESGEAADLIASEVLAHLLQFSTEIRESLGFGKFNVTQLGAPRGLAEQLDTYAVDVVVSYGSVLTWVTTPNVPRLKAVNVRPSGAP